MPRHIQLVPYVQHGQHGVTDHFVIEADCAVLVEVMLTDSGHLVVSVYDGDGPEEREPVIGYDSNLEHNPATIWVP